MSEIYKVCGLAVIALTTTAVLKNRGSSLSPYVPQITAIMIFTTAITALIPLIDFIKSLISGENGETQLISIILTATVIALISRAVSELCRESGEIMLKNAIEFSANAEIMLLCLPIIKDILSTAGAILKL